VRRILFLDFDGVLHPDGVGLFSRLGLFEEYLLKMPEAKIVISSSRRETHALEDLKANFSASLRRRIIGITPSLDDGYDSGGRQHEIEAFLKVAGLNGANSSWIALDDTRLFFEDDCSFLILTDPNQGFREIDGNSLLEWYDNSHDPYQRSRIGRARSCNLSVCRTSTGQAARRCQCSGASFRSSLYRENRRSDPKLALNRYFLSGRRGDTLQFES
jgi:hypothetical protein